MRSRPLLQLALSSAHLALHSALAHAAQLSALNSLPAPPLVPLVALVNLLAPDPANFVPA